MDATAVMLLSEDDRPRKLQANGTATFAGSVGSYDDGPVEPTSTDGVDAVDGTEPPAQSADP